MISASLEGRGEETGNISFRQIGKENENERILPSLLNLSSRKVIIDLFTLSLSSGVMENKEYKKRNGVELHIAC